MLWRAATTIKACASWALGLVLVAGCSDLKFVTSHAVVTEDDPRENIVLRGVDAQFTSGSLVQTRVVAATGTYDLGKGRLVLSDTTIHSRDAKSTSPAETRATTATFYLAADPTNHRAKGDFVLFGRVVHRVPAKDNSTTDAIVVETERLVWDGTKELFVGDSFYRMFINSAGKQPIVAIGDAFVASRDLRHCNVRHGGITTKGDTGDFRLENAKRKSELEASVPPEVPATAEGTLPREPISRTDRDSSAAPGEPGTTHSSTQPAEAPAKGRLLHRIPSPLTSSASPGP